MKIEIECGLILPFKPPIENCSDDITHQQSAQERDKSIRDRFVML